MKGDQKKVFSNEPKQTQTPLQTSKRAIPDNFSINTNQQGPSQGPLTPPLAHKLTKIALHSMEKAGKAGGGVSKSK